MKGTNPGTDENKGGFRSWPINEILLQDYRSRGLDNGAIAELHGVAEASVQELIDAYDM